MSRPAPGRRTAAAALAALVLCAPALSARSVAAPRAACLAPHAAPGARCRTATHGTWVHRSRWARHAWRHRYAGPVIPRWDPVESQIEVHQVYPYRTPYPYPALFGPF